MNASPQNASTRSNAGDLPAAEELSRALCEASPAQIVAAARRIAGGGRLALVSSFGTESAVLLKVIADIDPFIPVLFLDTGWLFEETLSYRDMLIEWLGLRDVRTLKPDRAALAHQDPRGDLWLADADTCCRVRKIEPLQRALEPFDAWINGRKRFQGGLRATIPVVEQDSARLKFNPLANVTRAEIDAIYRDANLPPHPLVASGFLSVGCMPCTSRTSEDEDPRAGRWRDSDRTECGIHTMRSS